MKIFSLISLFFVWAFNLLSSIVDDTLRREKGGVRRFSKASLTMFAASCIVFYAYLYDLHTHGFRIESFLIMVGLATGVQITDAVSKKLHNINNKE